MSSQTVTLRTSFQGSEAQGNMVSYPVNQKGLLPNGRTVVPMAQAEVGGAACGAYGICSTTLCYSIMGILFWVGIALWAVGAGNGNLDMVYTGKVLFGIGCIPIGCGYLSVCYVPSCGLPAACLGIAAGSSSTEARSSSTERGRGSRESLIEALQNAMQQFASQSTDPRVQGVVI